MKSTSSTPKRAGVKKAPAPSDTNKTRAPFRNGEVDHPFDALPDEPADEWPPPKPMYAGGPPLPLSLLPPLLRKYVDSQSRSMQVPPDLMLASMLPVMSAATRNAYRVAVSVKHGWYEQLSCYSIGLSDSGTRKTPTLNAAIAPLLREQEKLVQQWSTEAALNDEMFKHAKAKSAKLAKALMDEPQNAELREDANAAAQFARAQAPPRKPRLMLNDVTPEALAIAMEHMGGTMSIFSAEAGQVKIIGGQRYSENANTEIFNKGFSGDAYSSGRVSRAEVDLPRPFLAMGLLFQPTIAQGMASQEMDGSGLLARPLYVVPASLPDDDDPEPVSAKAEQWWADVVSVMFKQASDELSAQSEQDGASADPRRLIMLDETAYKAVREFGKATAPTMNHEVGVNSDVEAWMRKLPGLLVRLAALFLLIERAGDGPEHYRISERKAAVPALVVGEPLMESVIGLAPYLIAHAKIAHGIMRSPYTADDFEQSPILMWLRDVWVPVNGNTFRLDHAYQAHRRRAWANIPFHEGGEPEPSRRVWKELAGLTGRGWLKRQKVTSTGGRPAWEFRVNPMIIAGSDAEGDSL